MENKSIVAMGGVLSCCLIVQFLSDWPTFLPDANFVNELGFVFANGENSLSGLFHPQHGRSFTAIYSLGPWLNYQLDHLTGRYGSRAVLLMLLFFTGFLSYRFLIHSGVAARNALLVSAFFASDPLLLYSSQYGRADVWCLLCAVGGLCWAKRQPSSPLPAVLLALIPFFWIVGALYLLITGVALALAMLLRREWRQCSGFVLIGVAMTVAVGFCIVWSSPHALADSLRLTSATGAFSETVGTHSESWRSLLRALILYLALPLMLLIYMGLRERSMALLGAALGLVLFLWLTGAYYARAIYVVGGIWLILLVYLGHAPQSRSISSWWLLPGVLIAVLRATNIWFSIENPGAAALEQHLRPLVSENVVVYDTTTLARQVTRANDGIYVRDVYGEVAGFLDQLRPDLVIFSTSSRLPIKQSSLTVPILLQGGYCASSEVVAQQPAVSPMPSFFQRTYLGYRVAVGPVQIWSRCEDRPNLHP